MFFKSYKRREIDHNKKVTVYRNLHKQSFSIKQNNKVVGHATNFSLHEAEMKVSEAGRQRVIKDGQKNVHAWLNGYFEVVEFGIKDYDELYYNPYTLDNFINKRTGKRIDRAEMVYFHDNGKAYIVIEDD